MYDWGVVKVDDEPRDYTIIKNIVKNIVRLQSTSTVNHIKELTTAVILVMYGSSNTDNYSVYHGLL